MKKYIFVAVWAITLMGTMFYAYKEGYNDGKERRFENV